MRTLGCSRVLAGLCLLALTAPIASAQEPGPGGRIASIEQEQAEKAKSLHAYEPDRAERFIENFMERLEGGPLRWHGFFQSAYAGGGFTLGAGYRQFVSSYNLLDVRGSYTIKGYKRFESEFVAPRLFNRRGELSVLGGWREATQVGFFGVGPDTSKDDRTNYSFQQPYLSADLLVRPTRGALVLGGGAEFTQWAQNPGSGSSPSVETVYTPDTLPGLEATVNYVHTQGTVGFDWRTSPGYTRRGGYYGVTVHDYQDGDSAYGFNRIDYEVIQHIPILREAWTISLHGLARTAQGKSGQEIPFFMMPAVGGGSSLRGFTSWRFRDRNSLLLQAEWRIMVNRFLDTAFFYDAGKVAHRASDLDFSDLEHNYGFGVRFHGPVVTPLRVEVARSREAGVAFIFSASPSF